MRKKKQKIGELSTLLENLEKNGINVAKQKDSYTEINGIENKDTLEMVF